ncbi:MAG TPA: diaminopimelate decarboxylase, partial [Bryobacteraceae bacterium]|nr:diaminopimelate decarboxylase [Bryobacteraceae bacterium]
MSIEEWHYQDGQLFCEDAELTRIAYSHGTPTYVYSKSRVIRNFRAYAGALKGLPHRILYSVKANSSLGILDLLAREGAGFDIVSGGELYRVLAAGGDPSKIVFAGVGKTVAEIRFALEKGIHSFNCESEAEVGLISRAALALNRTASIAIRVNPDVDAATHPYISTGLRMHKFGVDIAVAAELYHRAAQMPGILAEGVSCHIGSQMLKIEPLLEAADRVLALVAQLRSQGYPIRHLDVGGGLGVAYEPDERGPAIQSFIERLKPRLAGLDLTLMLEPGRSVVADAGILLTRVLLLKQNGAKRFVVVDAAMNDLIRPVLYDAYHEITPVQEPSGKSSLVDVVGPICESGDFFARDRELSEVKAGDLLAIRTAGAYGFSLSSNYNSRPRPCELLVDGKDVYLLRHRETYEDLVRGELLP